ncbi:MAG: hypothetical protein C0434_04670 [Xanthomonadaceae bacterium]|nr:hypothetical protein [Xanthomonadaceae bacterium]
MTPDPIDPPLRAGSDLPEATLSSATAGPGRVIRQARERAKLGIEELATLTRLTRATLEALERDDFSNLTEAVYVRGYYRKCAKVLNLPEAELIAAYDKLYAPKNAPMATKLLLGNSGSTMGSSHPGSGGGAGWVIVLVIAVLIGVGAWFLTQDGAELASSPAAAGDTGSAAPAIPASALTVPPTAAAASSPAAAPPAAAAGSPADPASSASGAPATTGGVASPTPGLALTAATSLASLSAAEAPAPAVAAAPAPTPTTSEGGALLLDFQSSSWVRIEDADGRTLLSGTIPSGDRQVLRGRPPYSLFIGYAPGVKVEFDGKPFDLLPHIRQNSTARLNLPYVPAPQ